MKEEFIERDKNGIRLTVRKGWDIDELAELVVKDLGEISKDGHCQEIPTSDLTAVFRIKGFRKDLFFKNFLYRHWRHIIKAPFLKSKAKRAWEGGLLLQKEGFSIPPLVILGERRKFGGAIDRSFFVTEEVNGVLLYQYLKDGLSDRLSRLNVKKVEFIMELARTIGRLHRRGIYHGDLNIGNIMVDDSGGLNQKMFYFLDNEGYRRFETVPLKMVIHDLRDLNNPRISSISVNDRLRFFCTYLKENRALKAKKRELLKRLIQASQKRFGKTEG